MSRSSRSCWSLWRSSLRVSAIAAARRRNAAMSALSPSIACMASSVSSVTSLSPVSEAGLTVANLENPSCTNGARGTENPSHIHGLSEVIRPTLPIERVDAARVAVMLGPAWAGLRSVSGLLALHEPAQVQPLHRFCRIEVGMADHSRDLAQRAWLRECRDD